MAYRGRGFSVADGTTHWRIRVETIFDCDAGGIPSVCQSEVGIAPAGKLRFCGLEFSQDEYNIIVGDKDALSTPTGTPGEVEQVISFVGPLVWAPRPVRVDFCYRVSRLQANDTYVRRYHLKEANEVDDCVVRTFSFALFFKAGAFPFDDALVVGMMDASWANDKTWFNDVLEKRRSQRTRLVILCPPQFRCGQLDSHLPELVLPELASSCLWVYAAGRDPSAPVQCTGWSEAQSGARGHEGHLHRTD